MIEHVALRHMAGFRCAGGDCPDTCCAGWTVPIDAAHFARLEGALAGPDEAARAAFDAAVPLVPLAARTPGRHAVFAMAGPARACAFLEPDRWCGLQRAHGEALLPTLCAQYPRVVNVVEGRAELAGAPSCPEVARALLFSPDAADVIPLPAAALGERRQAAPARTVAPGVGAGLWASLRAALGTALAAPRPLRARLHAVAAAALEVAPLLAAPRVDLGAFSAGLEALAAPGAAPWGPAALRGSGRPAARADAYAVETVLEALCLRAPSLRHPSYVRYVAAWQGEAGEWPSAQALAAHVAALRPALRARFGGALDVAVGNLVRDALFRLGPAVAPREATGFLRALLVRAAAMVVLLAGDPRVAPALGEADAARPLAAALVEGAYAVARELEHDEEALLALGRLAAARVAVPHEAAALIALAAG